MGIIFIDIPEVVLNRKDIMTSGDFHVVSLLSCHRRTSMGADYRIRCRNGLIVQIIKGNLIDIILYERFKFNLAIACGDNFSIEWGNNGV